MLSSRSLAAESRLLCTVQYSSQPALLFQRRQPGRAHSGALLFLCIPGFLRLVYVSLPLVRDDRAERFDADWFPGYLFTALSQFSWVTWIVPANVVVNQLFGYQHGLGMSLLSFDWAQIAYLGSPLATPCALHLPQVIIPHSRRSQGGPNLTLPWVCILLLDAHADSVLHEYVVLGVSAVRILSCRA